MARGHASIQFGAELSQSSAMVFPAHYIIPQSGLLHQFPPSRLSVRSVSEAPFASETALESLKAGPTADPVSGPLSSPCDSERRLKKSRMDVLGFCFPEMFIRRPEVVI